MAKLRHREGDVDSRESRQEHRETQPTPQGIPDNHPTLETS